MKRLIYLLLIGLLCSGIAYAGDFKEFNFGDSFATVIEKG